MMAENTPITATWYRKREEKRKRERRKDQSRGGDCKE
jgi:hypothetical protein